MDRTILHCDCNSYFASVECIDHPEWKTVPMAVCGDPKRRHGIILAKNELAKAYGVKTAETIRQALNKCPRLLLVVPHHNLYEKYCEKINEIYLSYTDLVEPFSIDESWLDVTGSMHLFGTGKEIADALRKRVYEEIGVTISVGVSFNKIFAKLGSDYKKPNATTVISRKNFMDVLWPLDVQDMMFVGKASAETLRTNGILTIGDMARAGRERLCSLLGRSGETLYLSATGLDDSPVRPPSAEDRAKSVGCGTTFAQDLTDARDVSAALLTLCDRVGTRLRRNGQYCAGVQLTIRDPQFHTIQRSGKTDEATNVTKEIYATTLAILNKNWTKSAPIRMLTVTATNLTTESARQMRLIDDRTDARVRFEKLDGVMDSIRTRFGNNAISFASELQKKGSDEDE